MLDWVLNRPLKMLKSSIPVDTGHKLNVYKALRRRPGRLLNVLYTFKLRWSKSLRLLQHVVPLAKFKTNG